jgi:hypothetical protein
LITNKLIPEIMKILKTLARTFLLSLVLILLLTETETRGQQAGKSTAPFPETLNRIFSNSCTPCHTNKGGLMSRSRLNFNDWTLYSPEKQKEKADLIRSVLEKEKMPPKSARESRPEIILTKEQIGLIKNWADSLNSVNKK